MDETRPPFNDFARAGEAMVRDAVEHGRYSLGQRASAIAWLAWKDNQRQAGQDASQAEQTEIARSGKDAAWASAEAAREAAREAKKANTRATIALVIASISAIATITAAVMALIAWARPNETPPASSSDPRAALQAPPKHS